MVFEVSAIYPLYKTSLRMPQNGRNVHMKEAYYIYNITHSQMFICICWFYLNIGPITNYLT